jgi:hypothetical protein
LDAYLELAEQAHKSTMLNAASTIQELRDKIDRIQTAAENFYHVHVATLEHIHQTMALPDATLEKALAELQRSMAPLFQELGTWPYDPIEEAEPTAEPDTPAPASNSVQ